MKIRFLDTCKGDFDWLAHYYSSVFPDGRARAASRLETTVNMLALNPYIARPSEFGYNIRVLPIPRTPFKLLYRVTETHIEILRLKDSRDGYSE